MADEPNRLGLFQPAESARKQRERMRRLLAESITTKEVLHVKARLYDLAMDGDLQAIKEFLDRAAGRPVATDEEGEGDGPRAALTLHFDIGAELAARWDNPPPPRTIDVQATDGPRT